MRWTLMASACLTLDETLSAYGEVVWFWRCHAGAKSCVKSREATVTQLLTGEITI